MAILKDVPADSTVIDLEAARQARAEARAAAGDPTSYIKLEAGYVPARPEFDLAVIEHLRKGEVRDALSGLVADPADVDALIDAGLSAQDINVIVSFIGSTLGEASAS